MRSPILLERDAAASIAKRHNSTPPPSGRRLVSISARFGFASACQLVTLIDGEECCEVLLDFERAISLVCGDEVAEAEVFQGSARLRSASASKRACGMLGER